MTMTVIDPAALVGFAVFDSEGEQLGEVEGVYMGAEEPEWAAVLLPSGSFVVVPLAEAVLYEDSLDLPFAAAEIKAAPLQQAELLEDLTEEQEEELAAYFSGEADMTPAEVASTAKEQGQQVASTAKVQGQQVASTAKEQASELVVAAKEQAVEVADQASVQARNLLEETKTRLDEQTATGAARLGEQLQRLGEEALALSEGRPDEAPTVGGYVKRAANTLLDAADRAYGVSDDVQTRGIGGLLGDVQSFARRRPGVFIVGTAALGLVAGRAVRASKSDEDEVPAALPRRDTSSRGAR